MVVHWFLVPKVLGSNPSPPAIQYAVLAQLVERHTSNVNVSGSNPLDGTITP